jgi:hypothetical protein
MTLLSVVGCEKSLAYSMLREVAEGWVLAAARESAELSQHSHLVEDTPVLCDASLYEAENAHGGDSESSPRRGTPHELCRVRTPDCNPRCHLLTDAEQVLHHKV